MSEMLDETIDDVEAGAGAETDTGDEVARADEPAEVAAPARAPDNSWEEEQRIAGIVAQQVRDTLAQYAPQPEPPQFELDPLADNFGNQLVDLNGQLIDSKLAPLLDYVAQQQQAQTDTFIDTEFSKAASAANLEGADSALLRSVASHFASQPEFARYGASAQGVAAVAQKAAEWLAGERKSAGEAAIANYRKQIGEIAETPSEPSAGGGAGLRIESKPKTYDDIIAKYTS